MNMREFVQAERRPILERCLTRLRRTHPDRSPDELMAPVETMLDEVMRALRIDPGTQSEPPALPEDGRRKAVQVGVERRAHGFGVDRVVNDFGLVCDSIAGLGADRHVAFDAREVQVMNRCLDDGIAAALSAFLAEDRSEGERRSAQMLGAFAHEVRNALYTAEMASHLLRSGAVGTAGKTSDVLQRALARIQSLVGQALTEAQLAGGVKPVRERLLVAHLLGELVAGAYPERGVEVRLEADPDLEVEADPRLLESAVSNLLHNALKFTRDSEIVHVRARTTRTGAARIEVEDRCGGLAPGDRDIFAPFVHARDDRRGVGLGLAIARRAIESQGGRIWFRDLPGLGCVFIVELPACRAQAAPPRPAEP